MKHVVSISLGAAQGDHRTVIKLGGEQYLIERVGTDGSLTKMARVLKDYDGRVTALGLGGINFAYTLGKRRYPLPQAAKLKKLVHHTPLVDGAQVKDSMERWTVQWLLEKEIVPLKGSAALVVSVLDRYGLAAALEQAGVALTVGDAMFGLGLPLPLTSLAQFNRIATVTMPFLRHIPIQWLYPTGKKQLDNQPRWEKFYAESDLIVGDGHFIYRHLPIKLPGKTIITSTVTSALVQEFQRRGISRLITTSPWWGGRAFGANVLEGLVLARFGVVNSVTIREFTQEIKWKPNVMELN